MGLVYALAWLMFGVLAAVVASNKERSGWGWFLLGMLLGPFGFALSLVVSKDESAAERNALSSGAVKKCPFCAELIKSEALVCRYCGRDLCAAQEAAIDVPQVADDLNANLMKQNENALDLDAAWTKFAGAARGNSKK